MPVLGAGTGAEAQAQRRVSLQFAVIACIALVLQEEALLLQLDAQQRTDGITARGAQQPLSIERHRHTGEHGHDRRDQHQLDE